jgi:hypothetical protein
MHTKIPLPRKYDLIFSNIIDSPSGNIDISKIILLKSSHYQPDGVVSNMAIRLRAAIKTTNGKGFCPSVFFRFLPIKMTNYNRV